MMRATQTDGKKTEEKEDAASTDAMQPQRTRTLSVRVEADVTTAVKSTLSGT